MRLDSSGRLLLGTTTPQGNANADDLVVATSATTGITIRSGTNNSGNLFFADGVTGVDEYRGWLTYNHSTNKLTVGTNGSEALELDSSQNATFAGTVSDSKGDVRNIPMNYRTGAYTLLASDAGKHILSNASVTIPASVMAAGNAVTIVNMHTGDMTITQASGLTMYNTADASTGNRVLATRGMATILFTSSTTAYISGAGLS